MKYLHKVLCFFGIHEWHWFFEPPVDRDGKLLNKDKFCGWCFLEK